jgi:DNA (cytosine-5)-methyltransferase 1/tRNA (cytosine38-C5)-methyltransferase
MASLGGGRRALELFAGIGGFRAAVPTAEVVAAFDTSALAAAAYEAWWREPLSVRNLEVRRLVWPQADLWWASPPCQPYTVRGAQRDLDDPRARSLLVLLERIAVVRPWAFAMENVPGFVGSRAYEAVHATLVAGGYDVREVVACPTELGVPMERRRFYLVACLEPLRPPVRPSAVWRPLRTFLDPSPSEEETSVAPEVLARFGGAMHVIDADDPIGAVATFTSAYGRSPVYAGSYVREAGRVRRLSTSEGLRLLGFPDGLTWPDAVPLARRWGLVGNSLSVDAVRQVLGWLPGAERFTGGSPPDPG